MKTIAALALLAATVCAYAEGPGSRIRTTPEVPRLPDVSDQQDATRCERLRGDERDHCLREHDKRAPATSKPSGPETTGMGSGAGSGVTTGTSGGGSFGNAAPR